MWATPGKKLLFMGSELGQWSEWRHDGSVDWHTLEYPQHVGIQRWVTDLNRLYSAYPAMHELDFDPAGFSWIDANDQEHSVLSFLRSSADGRHVLGVFNFTPVPREHYHVGAPTGGFWRELLNSDAEMYGGSGTGNMGGVEATADPWHGRPFSLWITVPPLGAVLFAPED
jgi:1,4-alpha-glucan branching enzyme